VGENWESVFLIQLERATSVDMLLYPSRETGIKQTESFLLIKSVNVCGWSMVGD
jgi:hypothetical protein